MSNKLVNFHFADDTTALAKSNDIYELTEFVNNEIQKLGMWLRANKLAINASKTKIMIFHKKGKLIPNDLKFCFNNNDLNGFQDPNQIYDIERICNLSRPNPAFKILGVWLDENLNFDFHVSTVAKKVSKSLYCLKKVKNVLSTKALKSLYYALIHPYFLYCLIIYSCTNQKNLNKLFLLQKRCIRLISNSKYNAHTEPLFFSLNILPFLDLIKYEKLKLMHSIEYTYAPASFSNEFNKNNVNSDYLLRNNDDYLIPRIHTDFLRRFPLVSFPLAWNTLDPELKTIISKNVFKFLVKKYLIDKCEIFQCNKLFCYVCSRH